MEQLNYNPEKKNIYQIKEISPFSFSIGDTSNFSEYQSGGIVTQVKMQQEINFVKKKTFIKFYNSFF